MYPRVEYEMSEEDLQDILRACKPVPVMKVGSYVPPSPQDNANMAWRKLGEKMGFDYTTVRPIDRKGQRFFSAVPSETEAQREERKARQAEEKRKLDIATLKAEIEERKKKLEIGRAHV